MGLAVLLAGPAWAAAPAAAPAPATTSAAVAPPAPSNATVLAAVAELKAQLEAMSGEIASLREATAALHEQTEMLGANLLPNEDSHGGSPETAAHRAQLATEFEAAQGQVAKLQALIDGGMDAETLAPSMELARARVVELEAALAGGEHPTAAHTRPVGLEPDAALAKLTLGNERFVQGKGTRAGELPADRAALTGGQHPHTMVLTCADSRVPPELLFDQGLGELFVVRSVGNNVDEHLVASLEYAEEHLGTRLLVVMGHTSCGAVKAAVTTPVGTSVGSPSLDELVQDLRACMGPVSAEAAADPTLRLAVTANVHGVEHALLEASPILREGVETGQIKLVAALYDLTTGAVTFESSYMAAVEH